MDAGRVYCAATIEELLDRLRTVLQPGDRVLVKGSRGMRMERVTAQLRGDEPPAGH